MSVNVENKAPESKKPSAARYICGAIAGSTITSAAKATQNMISPLCMGKMAEISDRLSKDEFLKLQDGIKLAFDKSNLASKGVSVLKVNESNIDQVNEIMKNEFSKGPLKKLPKIFKEIFGKAYASSIKDGQNACYANSAKKILLPENKLNLSFFHEAGHAINDNMSVFGKVLQNSRSLGMLAIPISLIALFKNKKEEGEKPKNGFDKVTDFIKNNAGKLTLAAFAPTLAEEGLATIRGNKMAREVLNSDLAKKVAKTNALGFMTYALVALTSSVGIYLATKARDKIVHGDSKNQ